MSHVASLDSTVKHLTKRTYKFPRLRISIISIISIHVSIYDVDTRKPLLVSTHVAGRAKNR
jgi:hypothetical protein